MNNTLKISTIINSIVLILISSITGQSQSNVSVVSTPSSDSLSLQSVIKKIVESHPTIKSAQEALNNADARIGYAKTGYYPQVDMNANFANQGPVIKLTIPDMGTFSLFPANTYSASINYRQVVYDFGRTKQNVEIENESKKIGEQSLQQIKQKMALAGVNSFYTLAFLQEASRIKDEELNVLRSHLKYVETLKSTGSATDYQILSTKVKISSVESQKVDLLASLTIQQSFLNSLAGFDDNNKPVVREELDIPLTEEYGDSIMNFAFRNRDEIKINKERANLAGMKFNLIRSMNKPVISLAATGGAKNGFLPDLNKIHPNYVIGAGISVPIFDGLKTKYNLLQAKSALTTIEYDNEAVKRNITSEVMEAKEYTISASQKVDQSKLQLEQALKAYSLAETSFKSGVITNLELLDASTAVSESRLMLLKARIDYAASVYRLKAALGERIYKE